MIWLIGLESIIFVVVFEIWYGFVIVNCRNIDVEWENE